MSGTNTRCLHQGGVCLIEVSVKRELTVIHRPLPLSEKELTGLHGCLLNCLPLETNVPERQKQDKTQQFFTRLS